MSNFTSNMSWISPNAVHAATRREIEAYNKSIIRQINEHLISLDALQTHLRTPAFIHKGLRRHVLSIDYLLAAAQVLDHETVNLDRRRDMDIAITPQHKDRDSFYWPGPPSPPRPPAHDKMGTSLMVPLTSATLRESGLHQEQVSQARANNPGLLHPKMQVNKQSLAKLSRSADQKQQEGNDINGTTALFSYPPQTFLGTGPTASRVNEVGTSSFCLGTRNASANAVIRPERHITRGSISGFTGRTATMSPISKEIEQQASTSDLNVGPEVARKIAAASAAGVRISTPSPRRVPAILTTLIDTDTDEAATGASFNVSPATRSDRTEITTYPFSITPSPKKPLESATGLDLITRSLSPSNRRPSSPYADNILAAASRRAHKRSLSHPGAPADALSEPDRPRGPADAHLSSIHNREEALRGGQSSGGLSAERLRPTRSVSPTPPPSRRASRSAQRQLRHTHVRLQQLRSSSVTTSRLEPVVEEPFAANEE
ncbi:MAG: hypothetical protein M1818_006759 [Claussenomyces sp. TS43310]|nr:MAG: hypothetical protein M1818_006759 [Claussenomyces sp. TS43310]